jgi:NADPH2:quinone reductase
MKKTSLPKTGGRGVDLVIEMLANVNLVKDLDLIRQARPYRDRRQSWRARAQPARNHGEGCDGVGFTNWNALPAELATAHAAIVAGMERSGYKPQVGKEMPLADAPRAMRTC